LDQAVIDQPTKSPTYPENHLDMVALGEGAQFADDSLVTGEGFRNIIDKDYPWPMPRNSDEAVDRWFWSALRLDSVRAQENDTMNFVLLIDIF
jgi:hypothetical protein